MSAVQSNLSRAPFDGIADAYDTTFTYSRIGQAQRALVWRVFCEAFAPGDRVLDLGCGTGVDACFLAERGVKVLGVDCSSEMIRVAKRRVSSCGKQASVELDVLAIEQLKQLKDRAPFDGLISNFGALNCVEDLRGVARDLAALLRPGAAAFLCFLGPNCLWEIVWHMARGNQKKAFRRWRKAGTIARLANGSELHVRYPNVQALSDTFAADFTLKSWRGIGLAIPPSYVEPFATKFPPAIRFASRLDALFGRCPGVRGLADHVLLEFVRN